MAYSEKKPFSPEKSTPLSSSASSRSSSPHASKHHKRHDAEYRDFPHEHHHFYSRGHMHPPPPPPPPPPPGYPPHMMQMHLKDPFYNEFAQKKHNKSPFRKVLVGCVACLAGATVFTLGRAYEVHRINAVLNRNEDCGSWSGVSTLGANDIIWGARHGCKFSGEHSIGNNGFKGNGKFMEHGQHGPHHGPHHRPPPPPPDFIDVHMEESDSGEFDYEDDGAEVRRGHGKKHHDRRLSTSFLDDEVSDDDNYSGDETRPEHFGSRKHGNMKHGGNLRHEREHGSEEDFE